MRVVATSQGYDGLAVRSVDEEFDMPNGSTGTWFKPVVANAPVEVVEDVDAKVVVEKLADVHGVETPRRGRPPKAR